MLPTRALADIQAAGGAGEPSAPPQGDLRWQFIRPALAKCVAVACYGAWGDRLLGSLLALVDCLRLRGAGPAALGVPSSASLAFATIDPIRLFREARGLAVLLPAPFEEPVS